MSVPVRFRYHTGLRRPIFRNPRLEGSWDTQGRHSNVWTSIPLEVSVGTDGCPTFEATVALDPPQEGATFAWGVRVDAPGQNDLWAIMDEVQDAHSIERVRSFSLRAGDDARAEDYYFTHGRRLGAQKHYRDGGADPGIQFAVWAPNARAVEVVFGEYEADDPNRQTGYIADDGAGIDADVGPFTLRKTPGEPWDGVWETDPDEPALADFRRFDHRPYMFRITRDDGSIAYRTDLYSRCQIGKGRIDPDGKPYAGHYTDLDGTKGCSVVIDPDTVTEHFREKAWPEIAFQSADAFWRVEMDHSRPLPTKVEDLIIYELHVGSLGYGRTDEHGGPVPGTFADVIEPAFLDYLEDLGVNAIELLPVMEFEGDEQWGYGTSHYFALEYSAGGRDQLKHLVRACHRRGIAVILDVVYNHYHHQAERAQWMYDTTAHERNAYYWYEGHPHDYAAFEAFAARCAPHRAGHGGYVDNMSTGWAPRYYEEMVRKLFVSSAVALVEEFHIDGLRVDQTTSMHGYNNRHADGAAVGDANIFGAKLLRQLSLTLRAVRPQVMLMAEDHSEWDKVTQPTDQEGLGFDAAWFAAFYHHLVGDAKDRSEARLLKEAGMGDDRPLRVTEFAAKALARSRDKKVVYSESHDEAGNAEGTARTIVVAVNGAPFDGAVRRYAEARSRYAFGMAMLSAGTPMFLMGEEVGAAKCFRYKDTARTKEDLFGMRRGEGARIFAYYADLVRFRLRHPAVRSHNLEVVHVHDTNRVAAFVRRDGTGVFLVVSSLNNRPFASGYVIQHPSVAGARWKEVFNSDAARYGGDNVGNGGATLQANGAELDVVVPANGIIILRRL